MSDEGLKVCEDCARPVRSEDYGRPCEDCGGNWAVGIEDWAELLVNAAYGELLK